MCIIAVSIFVQNSSLQCLHVTVKPLILAFESI